MKNARRTAELPAPVRELIDGRNFTVVATLNPAEPAEAVRLIVRITPQKVIAVSL